VLSQASAASEAGHVEEGGRDGSLRVNGMARVLLSRYGEPSASSQSAEEAMKVRLVYAYMQICLQLLTKRLSKLKFV
jgi:hypothetical protein